MSNNPADFFVEAHTAHKFIDRPVDDDKAFHELLDSQAPHLLLPMVPRRAADQGLAQETAFRNGTVQGAYLVIAAGRPGLGAGPMSGFGPAPVDQAVFPDGRWKSNFLVNLGFASPAGDRPTGPRLDFDQAARFG